MTVQLNALVSPSLYMAADIHTIEQQYAATASRASLMEKAGAAVARLAGTLARDTGEPILVLVGPGNNGGDALVAALRLKEQGFRVTTVSPARVNPTHSKHPSPDAARALSGWLTSGGEILYEMPRPQTFSLVIDGLFGIGLQRDITGVEADWIAQANSLNCPRFAIDIPSGLDSDSGQIRGCAFRADHTLTFPGLKPGLLTADGPDHAGIIHLDTLDVDPGLCPTLPGIALTQLTPQHTLPPRMRNSHKGTFGHIGIIGGHTGMVGACLIAGRAALQYGAGSVTLGTLDERIVVDYSEPRLMFASPEALLSQPMQALALGPGLGQSARACALLESALVVSCPLVLDADALNLLASHPALAERVVRRNAPTLLTPHPGEAGRLLNVPVSDLQANRIEAARTISRQFNAEVALKGAGTVIAHPGTHYAINTSGGPWLAQAGSGDRLTGMVTALLGQGMCAGDALEAAVWLHGSPTGPLK